MYQTDPSLPPKATLPTMYDLPSEDPEDPGLPDQFHIYQPRLLEETFRPPSHALDEILVATDLNLYYDVRHPLWHKRPDWFAVLGVPRLYENRDLRLSYVIWQEGLVPTIVLELLSPGTEKEDLGQVLRVADQPPPKWEVYEQILQVPYYGVYSRHSQELRVFENVVGRFGMVAPSDNGRWWLPKLGLGLGLWEGSYADIRGTWLRWCTFEGTWLLTDTEQERLRVEQECQRAEQEYLRAEQEHLRAEQECQRAEQECQRAEQECQRAEQECQRAEQERLRAEQECQRAEQEQSRAERLAAQLRSLGIEPHDG